MPYNEPTFGESGEVYTDNVRNSLAHVKSAAEAAQATADNAVASIVTTSQTADEAKEIALAAQGYLETPTDGRVAEHINDPSSATRAALAIKQDVSSLEADVAAKVGTAGPLDTALSAPYGRADWTFIPANRLIAAVGSPSLVSTSATVRWLMDAASVEQVAMTLGRGEFPKQWTQFDIYAVWVNESATSGNVVLRADVVAATGEGSVIPAPVNVGAPTFTAPTVARQVAIDKINTNPLTAPTDLQAVSVLISRRASDAADTLANDIGLLGVVLGKP